MIQVIPLRRGASKVKQAIMTLQTNLGISVSLMMIFISVTVIVLLSHTIKESATEKRNMMGLNYGC